ncbi:MAG: hypothetical protein MI867_04925, partial [Pseudomonadales bacterium]|nr:hypothetical protein [Pseudomonadales bacterium]
MRAVTSFFLLILRKSPIQVFKLSFIASFLFLTTGCLPKIDKDLPSLSYYQQTEGWYEDAFIRVYKRDLQAGVHPLEENFTHPWIVVKRSNTEDIFSFELTEF